MKKTVKKMMLGMLVLSILVNCALISNPSTADAADTAELQTVVVTGVMSSPALSEIQYQKFMSYLTQEYAPEMKAAWQQACVDRQSIQSDIDVQFQPGTTFTSSTAAVNDSITKAKSFTVNSTVNDKKESGVISISIAESPENNVEFINQLNLQNELDQAIINNDSKAINNILGKMLTDYKQITEDMKNNLSKVEITDK